MASNTILSVVEKRLLSYLPMSNVYLVPNQAAIISIFLLTFLSFQAYGVETCVDEEYNPFSGRLKFGGALNTGNSDNKNLDGELTLEYEADLWDLTAGIEGEFAAATGETTAQNIATELSGRRALTESAYWFVKSDVTWDKFATYDFIATESIGLGRYLWRTCESSLTFELGPGMTHRTVAGTDELENEAVLSLDSTYTYKISDTANFKQTASVDIDRLNTHIEAVSSIKTKITEFLALEISFKVAHDTRIPPGSTNQRSTDTVTKVGIVYDF